jgi:hypothetical protein
VPGVRRKLVTHPLTSNKRLQKMRRCPERHYQYVGSVCKKSTTSMPMNMKTLKKPFGEMSW